MQALFLVIIALLNGSVITDTTLEWMHEMLHILNPTQADWYEFQIYSQKENCKKWKKKNPDLSVCMLRIGYHI